MMLEKEILEEYLKESHLEKTDNEIIIKKIIQLTQSKFISIIDKRIEELKKYDEGITTDWLHKQILERINELEQLKELEPLKKEVKS